MKAVSYGASGHGKVIHSILMDMGISVVAFVDNDPNLVTFMGLPVFHSVQSIDLEYQLGLISIGNNTHRKNISQLWDANYLQIAHASAYTHSSVYLGMGTVVMQHATVQVGTSVGDHCIINTGAIVDHDCAIGDFVHIAPGSTLCGGVEVGEGSLIGAGSTILPLVKIGKWCTVGAGSVVLKDVPDGATVVGNPAKVIGSNSVKDGQ